MRSFGPAIVPQSDHQTRSNKTCFFLAFLGFFLASLGFFSFFLFFSVRRCSASLPYTTVLR
jgi:hypothetical protein